jgi:uncharacterized protein (DUF885 family)
MKHRFRSPVIALASLLIILVAGSNFWLLAQIRGASRSDSATADAEFESLTDELFVQEVSASTISLHYTLEHPEDYGIENLPVTYGNLTTDSSGSENFIRYYRNLLTAFDTDALSPDNQLTYNILTDYLDTSLQESKYMLYEEPLSPVTGIHAQLPVLLAEFPLHDKEDVEDYLALLSVTQEYFRSIVEFEQEKSKQGLFCSDAVLDEILAQCSDFINMEDNYMISSFDERLEDVPGLNEKLRKQYRKQNRQLVNYSVLSAYKELMESLEQLRGTGTNDGGVCNLPDGKDYFTVLVRSETGSDRSLAEMKSWIETQLNADLTTVSTVYSANPSLRTNPPAVTSLSPSEILQTLQERFRDKFPDISKVSVTVKYVPESLEEHLSPAFYLIPPIDDRSSQVIYLNNVDEMESAELFTTLAHEGYPGHLYQNTWMNEHCTNSLQKILNFGGYTEGWATYVEMMSYYAAGLSTDEAALLQASASANLGLYAYCDLMIHGYGWTLGDTKKFLKQYGITDSTIVTSIYDLILGDPANYLKYYVGYLEFMDLKKEARQSMSDFSESKFHQSVLNAGPASFPVLREQLFSHQ